MTASRREKQHADVISLHVPFRIVKRGGRKEMQLPYGIANHLGGNSTLIKAIARAFRWKRMLDSGEFSTILELAKHEGIASSYMTRLLRLTLLAPDVVERIIENKEPLEGTLGQMLEPFPDMWYRQTWATF
jgi:hypothetical protein